MAIKKVVHKGDVLIDLSESTIAPENVLAGEIGFNSKGERFEGTMLPGSGNIPEGFIKPQGQVVITNTDVVNVTEYASAVVQDANLLSENIKKNVVILGIEGTLEASADEEAITSAILSREW